MLFHERENEHKVLQKPNTTLTAVPAHVEARGPAWGMGTLCSIPSPLHTPTKLATHCPENIDLDIPRGVEVQASPKSAIKELTSTCSRMCGFPTTTISARALVTATLNLLGFARKPSLLAASIAKNSWELLTWQQVMFQIRHR